MTENKTRENDASVSDFLNTIEDEQKRHDSFTVLALLQKVTSAEPKMWGTNIVGFGRYHYRYQTGREGDWFWVGFSPRKQDLTLYLNYGYDQHTELLKQLGRYKTGKACLYIRKIEDVNLVALEELVRRSAEPFLKANSVV